MGAGAASDLRGLGALIAARSESDPPGERPVDAGGGTTLGAAKMSRGVMAVPKATLVADLGVVGPATGLEAERGVVTGRETSNRGDFAGVEGAVMGLGGVEGAAESDEGT